MKKVLAILLMFAISVTLLGIYTDVYADVGEALGRPDDTSGGTKETVTSYVKSTTGEKVATLKNPLCKSTSDPNCAGNSVVGIVGKFLEIFSYLVIIFAVLALIWVGFQFVLAQGNVEKMKELKNWLLYIVIGVAIVIGSRIIVTIIINTLDASGAVSSDIIRSANQVIKN